MLLNFLLFLDNVIIDPQCYSQECFRYKQLLEHIKGELDQMDATLQILLDMKNNNQLLSEINISMESLENILTKL